jgi:hypothetical protein
MAKKDTPTCRDLLHDEAQLERRVETALESFTKLRAYGDLLDGVETMEAEEHDRCPGLADALTDQAYEAEAAGRVLIAAGVQTANELRDSGHLYEAVQALAGELKVADSDELASWLEREHDEIRDRYGEVAGNAIQEAADRVRQAKLAITSSDQRLVLTRPAAQRKLEEVALAFGPQPGQRGRVSVADFFSPDPAVARVWPGRLYLPPDCHHRPVRVRAEDIGVVDAYAGVLAGLAATKGSLYQHARRVDEVGHRGMRGNDPVSAILIGIAVVGAVVAIVGAATGNTGLIAFGVLLIVGAALVAFGGWTLIIGVLA